MYVDVACQTNGTQRWPLAQKFEDKWNSKNIAQKNGTLRWPLAREFSFKGIQKTQKQMG